MVGFCDRTYYVSKGHTEITIQQFDKENVLTTLDNNKQPTNTNQYFIHCIKDECYAVMTVDKDMIEYASNNRWKRKEYAQSEIDFLIASKEGKINV